MERHPTHMTSTTVTVSAPATVANLVCGFDILGLALESPADILSLSLLDEPVIRIRNLDDFGLPADPEKNICGAVLASINRQLPSPVGFDLVQDKRIKPGSGIGSSAASAAATAVAANFLLGNRFTQSELISFAMDGEVLASGARHADNVASCILGGITLVRTVDPLDVLSIPFPPLYVTVIHPHIEVKTSEARSLLLPQVSLKLAVKQWANVAGLVTGLHQSDYGLIARSLEDFIIEPQRSKLIPYFYPLKKACLDAGALGGGISGAGPSVFMFSETRERALAVEDAMKQLYVRTGIPFLTYVSTIGKGVVQV